MEDINNSEINYCNDLILNGSGSVQSDSTCDSSSDGNSVVKTHFSPGKVVRRRKNSAKHQPALHRASFPQARPQLSESKTAQSLEEKIVNISLTHSDDNLDNSTERLEGDIVPMNVIL